MKFAHIAQRLFNRPLAITPEKAEVVMVALAERLGITTVLRGGAPVAFFDASDDEDWESSRRRGPPPYDMVGDVARIEICGTLVAKLGCIRPYSGMTGYDGIRAAFLEALADDDVRAIVLDIDSPGGEVAGCFDLVDTIYRARGTKPIWAILSEHAYSAGYALASAADRVTVPRTGGVGSVGVIVMHVDMSRALDKAGLAVTLIHYGDRKADGNEYEPLADPVAARIQADIDELGELFVSTVARNRGLKPAAVRETQAGTFLGQAGVDVGFADAVMAPDEAFRALIKSL